MEQFKSEFAQHPYRIQCGRAQKRFSGCSADPDVEKNMMKFFKASLPPGAIVTLGGDGETGEAGEAGEGSNDMQKALALFSYGVSPN
eukprot:8409350-Lingulodinium_polyedra.AAC.1